jgi:carbon-monoxide dehydrogenase small subunit
VIGFPDMNDPILVRFRLNGSERQAEIRAHELLIDFIRDRLGLTGTKKSCDIEICGACTVILDGKAVSSCSMFAYELDGKEVTTIEGLAQGGKLHPLQEAFIERGGFQCGFCTSGMILLAKTLLDQNPDPSRKEVQNYMDANICRCTGYQMILESILLAAEKMRGKSA